MNKLTFQHWLEAYRMGIVYPCELGRPEPARTAQKVPALRKPPKVTRKGKVRAKQGHGYSAGRKRNRWMLADPCAYCGEAADTWDHIEPKSKGGDHSDGNLARVCHACNHEKQTRKLLVFLALRAVRKANGSWRKMPGLQLRKGR